MDCQLVKICILLVCICSVSSQSGYEYLKPLRPLSSSIPLDSRGREYFRTTVANLPIQDYTSGTIRLTTPSSLGRNISSTSSATKFRSDDNIPGRENLPTRYTTGRPSFQFPGIDTPQFSTSKVPQYAQYEGVPSFPTYPETIESSRYPDVTSLGQEPVVEDDYSAIPGSPGIDYPLYAEIPLTSFRCDQQLYPGYYADVETQCQVFHVCANNRTYDFLCPNGTIFHQEYLVCVWWNTFDCNLAVALYETNAKIYEYSIKQSQNFFDNIQSIRGGQRLEFSNISNPILPSGPERVKDGLPNDLNQRTGQPGTSRFQYTVPSSLQNVEGRGPEGTSSSIQFLQRPSLINQFPSNYPTEDKQFYGYPRGIDYDSRFVTTGNYGPSVSSLNPSSQTNELSRDSSKVAGYPSGIPQGPGDQSYRSGSRDSSKVAGYPSGIPQGPGDQSYRSGSRDSSKVAGYPSGIPQGPGDQSYRNKADQYSGQQPIREYLPPVQK